MNRKSLSFRIPEKTPMKKKQKEELDILTYGKRYWLNIISKWHFKQHHCAVVTYPAVVVSR